jgi:hypothetical protein
VLFAIGHGCFWGSIAAALAWVGFSEPYRHDLSVSLIAGLIILSGISTRYAFAFWGLFQLRKRRSNHS